MTRIHVPFLTRLVMWLRLFAVHEVAGSDLAVLRSRTATPPPAPANPSPPASSRPPTPSSRSATCSASPSASPPPAAPGSISTLASRRDNRGTAADPISGGLWAASSHCACVTAWVWRHCSPASQRKRLRTMVSRRALASNEMSPTLATASCNDDITGLEPPSDPATETFRRYELEPNTLPHNLIVGSDGAIWYAGNRNARIGRLVFGADAARYAACAGASARPAPRRHHNGTRAAVRA